MPDTDGSLTVGQRIGQVETAVIGLATRVDRLESWRDELRGMSILIKIIFGTSILGTIVALTTLYLVLAGSK